jgi:hypothetical protein
MTEPPAGYSDSLGNGFSIGLRGIIWSRMAVS